MIKTSMLEIRAGTGGDEAAIFAGDLWRMYQRFCDQRGLKLTVLDVTEAPPAAIRKLSAVSVATAPTVC